MSGRASFAARAPSVRRRGRKRPRAARPLTVGAGAAAAFAAAGVAAVAPAAEAAVGLAAVEVGPASARAPAAAPAAWLAVRPARLAKVAVRLAAAASCSAAEASRPRLGAPVGEKAAVQRSAKFASAAGLEAEAAAREYRGDWAQSRRRARPNRSRTRRNRAASWSGPRETASAEARRSPLRAARRCGAKADERRD